MKRLIEYMAYPHKPERGLVRLNLPPQQVRQGGDAYYHCVGLLVNWRALWVGAHYSTAHKRLCVNLLPCVTLWWTRPGGQMP